MANPYVTGLICTRLGMTRRELGQRMDNWELNVFWPAWLREESRQKEIAAEEAEREAKSRRSRL